MTNEIAMTGEAVTLTIHEYDLYNVIAAREEQVLGDCLQLCRIGKGAHGSKTGLLIRLEPAGASSSWLSVVGWEEGLCFWQ